MKFSKASIALLIVQLILVSSVAAKYFYQRASCPRVWTRTAAYDPSLVMRGRYLSLQLTVDPTLRTQLVFVPTVAAMLAIIVLGLDTEASATCARFCCVPFE